LIRPHTGDRRGAHRVLVGKSEAKTPPGRPALRWDNNIKMDLPKIKMRGCGLDCCGSRWEQVASSWKNTSAPCRYKGTS